MLTGLIFVIICSGFFGAVPLSWKSIIISDVDKIIFILRFKRIILGAMVRGMLSVAGVIFQAVLRNPLADPYILGVSSGGGLGVALFMIWGNFFLCFKIFSLPLSAFLGSVLSIFLVQRLAKVEGRLPAQNLLLSGIVVGDNFY